MMGWRRSEEEGTGFPRPQAWRQGQVTGLKTPRLPPETCSFCRPSGLPSHLCSTIAPHSSPARKRPSIPGASASLGKPGCFPQLSGGRGAAFSLHGGTLLSWPGDAVLPPGRGQGGGGLRWACTLVRNGSPLLQKPFSNSAGFPFQHKGSRLARIVSNLGGTITPPNCKEKAGIREPGGSLIAKQREPQRDRKGGPKRQRKVLSS